MINIGTYGETAPADPARPGQVLMSPSRVERLGCEAQITVSPQGIINAIRMTRDSDGEGLSLSRCAEVFGVAS
ncbi:hypothetical protein [Mangrovibrevibacter kandeliae]|uniref:hypothetical protein n=1 Tax=Mangrovibrevibacter kandeliae TaxID=2968473 RepID=UPI002118E79E|nr:hypothetical protein [Aurantimonas sp. CSK15Z-1]MCQ8781507.1 hypothetical protein [Aurantimonas sp. CSK15Z-1]